MSRSPFRPPSVVSLHRHELGSPRLQLIVAAAIAVVACDSDPQIPDPPPPPIEAIDIAQRLPSLFVGDTLQLRTRVVLEEGSEEVEVSLDWTSLEPAVATVSGAGLVTGRSQGLARTVASGGGVADTVSVAVLAQRVAPARGITYVLESDPFRLVLDPLDGSAAMDLSDDRGGVLGYEWSPDGERLLVTYFDTTDTVVSFLTSHDGSVLSQFEQPLREGQWSPGGDRISFRDGGLMVVPGEGGTPSFVSSTRGDSDDWSPDGRQIAFVSADGIRAARSDGSGEVVFDLIGSPVDLNWGPDGKRVAFVTSGAAWTIASDGAGETLRHLVPTCVSFGTCPPPTSYGPPDWSPDARSVAFRTSGNAGCFVFVLDPDTRAASLVEPWPCTVEGPLWSPDGVWLASKVFSFQPEGPGILLMRADGTARRIVPTAVDIRHLRWRP